MKLRSASLGAGQWLLAWHPGAWIDEAEISRWGNIAAALAREQGARVSGQVRSDRADLVQHDLAQLLARAEFELAAGDSPTAARQCLTSARELLAHAPRTSNEAEDPIDVRALIEQEARRAAASASALDVRVRVRVSPDVAARQPARVLERVVRNLIVNALQASPRGASVHVEVGCAAGELVVSVRDEGRGMTARAAERLFIAGAERPRGRGLGALSVGACVAELGGSIAVRSRPGRGTEIELRVPADARAGRVCVVDSLQARGEIRRARHADIEPTETSASVVDAGSPRASFVIARGAIVPDLAMRLAAARSSGTAVRVVRWDETTVERT